MTNERTNDPDHQKACSYNNNLKSVGLEGMEGIGGSDGKIKRSCLPTNDLLESTCVVVLIVPSQAPFQSHRASEISPSDWLPAAKVSGTMEETGYLTSSLSGF